MPLRGVEQAIVEVVEKVKPCVVTVHTIDIEPGMFFEPVPTRMGLGSGFIVDKRGVIVTANHTVRGAEIINVIFHDGTRVRAELLYGDPYTDVAILRAPVECEQALELGDSDKLKVGQIVLAVGNPLGLGITVSAGVVSAVHRSVRTQFGVLHNMIQTDCAINPGNSGGPLIDLDGRVVGMCTAIIPYAQGIGFAVPSNTIKKVLHDVLRYGRVLYPYFGAVLVQLTPQIAAYYGIPVKVGALVAQVEPGSPAEEAGLRPGDVIVEVENVPIVRLSEFIDVLYTKKPGDVISVGIMRGRTKYVLRVRLARPRA